MPRMTVEGHEERLPRRRLRVCSGSGWAKGPPDSNDSSGSVSRRYSAGGRTGQTGGEGTFAGTHGNDEDAPILAIPLPLVRSTKRTLNNEVRIAHPVAAQVGRRPAVLYLRSDIVISIELVRC
jgi:hypothetical protein